MALTKTGSILQIAAVVAMTLMMMLLPAANAQAQIFVETAVDGSCRQFKYTSPIAFYARLLPFFGQWAEGIDCRLDSQVVNSAGRCVFPTDLNNDRCFKRDFTEGEVEMRCASGMARVFADPVDCSSYYDCSRFPVKQTCPAGMFYDDIMHICRSNVFVKCNKRPAAYDMQSVDQICSTESSLVFPGENCNTFYNCSEPTDPTGRFLPYVRECTYGQLFDMESNTCMDADLVECDLLPVVKYICDLRQRACAIGQHCRPCTVDFPNCSNLPDGDQPFLGREYTPVYAKCQNGYSVGTGQCETIQARDGSGRFEARLFSARTKQCEEQSLIPRSLGGQGSEYDD